MADFDPFEVFTRMTHEAVRQVEANPALLATARAIGEAIGTEKAQELYAEAAVEILAALHSPNPDLALVRFQIGHIPKLVELGVPFGLLWPEIAPAFGALVAEVERSRMFAARLDEVMGELAARISESTSSPES